MNLYKHGILSLYEQTVYHDVSFSPNRNFNGIGKWHRFSLVCGTNSFSKVITDNSERDIYYFGAYAHILHSENIYWRNLFVCFLTQSQMWVIIFKQIKIVKDQHNDRWWFTDPIN